MTQFALLMARCGLSQAEAAAFLEVRLDTVKSWCAGRNPARQSIIDELRELYTIIEEAAEDLEAVLKSGDRPVVRVWVPKVGEDARRYGFPCVGAHAAAVGIAIARLPRDVPVEVITGGITRSTPTAAAN